MSSPCLVIGAQCLIFAGPLVWFTLTMLILTAFCTSGILHKPSLARRHSVWHFGIAWLNLLAMWGMLQLSTLVRNKIDERVGHLNDANK